MKRTATVIWKGAGKEGSGTISTQSAQLVQVPFAWNTRFADEPGTNPEELIAAAHAACFSMKLSFVFNEAGFTAETIETTAQVHLEKDSISRSHLTVEATVPGIGREKFEECVQKASDNCIVARALNMKITLEMKLSDKKMDRENA